MSRLIETLHAGRCADSGRRELGLVQASDTISSGAGRESQLHRMRRHMADPAIRPPHFLTQSGRYRHPSSIQRRRTGNRTAQPHTAGNAQTHTRATQARTTATPQVLSLDSHSLQAYSQLIGRMSQALDLSEPRAIALTSGLAREGKTSVAIDLAFAAVTNTQRHVLFIDADLTSCQASERLGARGRSGLAEVLADGVHPSEAICTVAPAGFDLLAAGTASRQAIDLLGSRRMDVLLWDLKQSYDLIIVDTPHLTKDSVAQFSAGFDAIYLVVRMLWTGPKAIDRALALLQNEGISCSGCILAHTGLLPCVVESDRPVEEWQPISSQIDGPIDVELPQTPGVRSESVAKSTTSTIHSTVEQTDDDVRAQSEITAAGSDNIGFVDTSEKSFCGRAGPDSIDTTTAWVWCDEGADHSNRCDDGLGASPALADSEQAAAANLSPLVAPQSNTAAQPDQLPGVGIDLFADAAYQIEEPVTLESQARTNEPPSEDSLDLHVADVSESVSPFELFDAATRSGDLEISVAESPAETLRKLETLRPFDPEFDPMVNGLPKPHIASSDCNLDMPSVIAEEENDHNSPPDNVATPQLASEESSTAIASLARPFRIPRVSRGLLQSGNPKAAAALADRPPRDPWAADILALSGLLLIAASILYVASDALLWF